MKNSLEDLNNHLFDTLERLLDDDMTESDMQKEITRSQAVTKIAETIIHSGELQLRTIQQLNDWCYENDKGNRASVPQLLVSKGDKYVK